MQLRYNGQAPRNILCTKQPHNGHPYNYDDQNVVPFGHTALSYLTKPLLNVFVRYVYALCGLKGCGYC